MTQNLLPLAAEPVVHSELRPNGTSKTDHVSPSSIGSHLGGSRRDQPPGLHRAVKYAAIHRDFMNRPPALGASCAARGAWMSVLVYASDLETDLLEGCHGWDDRMWLTACGVALEDVGAAVGAGLLVWENDGSDLRVLGFDHAGLHAVEAKRVNGSKGGRPREPIGSRAGNPSSNLPDPDPSQPFQYPVAFDLVWSHTGKKGAKHTAHKAWAKGGRPSLEEIKGPWAAYLASDRPMAGFIKDLSTWLNERGWQQEWPEATKAPPSATGSATRTPGEPFQPLRNHCDFHLDGKENLFSNRPSPNCPPCKHLRAKYPNHPRHVSEDQLFGGK